MNYNYLLYDKWLEPPIWEFLEIVVKAFRSKGASGRSAPF